MRPAREVARGTLAPARCAWLLLLAACASVPPPPSGAEAYVRALERGDLDAAWALTSPGFRSRTPREEYRARLADPASRAAHVASLRAALAGSAPELLDAAPASVPAEAVRALARATRAGRFDEALRWLAAADRARYTPARLEADWRAAPGAEARLQRALAAVESPPRLEGAEARWPLPAGGAVRVVLEADGPRVAALE